MVTTTDNHTHFRALLEENNWDGAQALWLDLATELADQPEFLLVLIQELADAGQSDGAAELAGLLAPALSQQKKLHEWLYALKLQARATHVDRSLNSQLIEAYQLVYESDPRLTAIFTAAGLDDPRAALPAALAKADTLLALSENSFCHHKSWGFGQVKTFDSALNRVIITFAHNPDHAMQLPYAADSVTPINNDHIEARKATDLTALQDLAGKKPLELLRVVLASHGRAATAAQVESSLASSVVPEDQWKKWWSATRTRAKRDPHFEIPTRKTEPVILRRAPVSQQDELLQAFRDAVGLARKTKAASKLLKAINELDTPDLVIQEFHDGLLTAIEATAADKADDRLAAALVLEDLLTHQSTPTARAPALAADILRTAPNLPTLLASLPAGAQKRATAILKEHDPDLLRRHLNRLPVKALEGLGDFLGEAALSIAQQVQNQTANLELLYWLCRQRTNDGAPAWLAKISGSALFAAAFNAIENANTRSETKRLRDLLLNDMTMITELLADATPDVVRDHARQILRSTAFDELDRRSLMARLVKEFPFVQDLLVTKTKKEPPLIVSKASFEKRQAELQEIVQKKIPENSREIGVARSYGDLRENFEFKAAKDMQRLLMKQRAELESMLTRATPTDFAEVKTDMVQIGTSVTVIDEGSGQSETYHVLGAWDGDPNRNILSYPAALAQALLDRKPGESISVNDDTGTRTLRIDRVETVPATILQAL